MNNRDILADKLDFTYKKEENVSEFRNLMAVVINYWYLFAAGVAICLIAAFCYIQYLPSQWNIASKIIVEDDKNSPSKSLTSNVSSDLSSLFDIKSNADNEVKVLKSRSLLKKVIADLNINIHVYKKSALRSTELFGDAPFTVQLSNNEDLPKISKYVVEILNADTYRLTDSKNDVDVTGSFGRPVQLANYNLVLDKAKKFEPEGKYNVIVKSLKQAENELAGKFTAGLDDKQATVIDLQLSYENPKKGELILQKFMQFYLQNNLANKIRIADSTMKFIDNRLIVVGAELNKVEKNLERYKVSNKISDINAQSKALIEGANDYQKKLNDNDVQLAVVNDLYKYVNDVNNPQVVPSSLITKDMSFGSAINAYNEMLIRKEQLKLTLLETSPVIKNLDQQIELARTALMSSLKNYRHSLQISQAEVKQQNSEIDSKIANAPVKERIYLDYSREQSLKQDLYLYLLQKREETAISQTATISNCRILDNAESEEDPYGPKRSLIYTIALFAGLFIPATGLSLKELFNTRISTKADIEKHTDVPLLGEISRNNNKKKLLIYNDARSIISEEIRALRASLKYVTDRKKSNVIMFTSSMSGEGKSFISLNLGNSIAMSGKKVVLLELDLRKPKLLKYIGVNTSYGFTDYVVSEDSDLDKLIKPSTFNDNFYFISSGTVPPNPAELLMGDQLKTLIQTLKKKFDYVIIDTAPVGMVADALIIEEFADITCFVVRQNYTHKSQLGVLNDLRRSGKIKQLYLIVNDIEVKNNNITGYGYGYGNYNYQEDESNKLSAMLKKLKPSYKHNGYAAHSSN